MADLGRWLSGDYSIPAAELANPDGDDNPEDR